jgi:hypothetical protein
LALYLGNEWMLLSNNAMVKKDAWCAFSGINIKINIFKVSYSISILMQDGHWTGKTVENGAICCIAEIIGDAWL